jgi:phytoene dehydrogenase-like protein
VVSVVTSFLEAPAPDLDAPGPGDIWNLLKTGRHYRALERRNRYRLLRWAPMPVADLTREWFQSDVLCASLAGPAISGTMFGPRSAGSGLVLLLNEAARRLAGGMWRARGGPGAITQAMAAAARAAGAEIRTSTRVEQILVANDRVSGVIAGGQRIDAAAVLSAVDPKTTFLNLMDPADLPPDFRTKIRNYRASGTVAKVNLALSALPAFGPSAEALSGRIHIGPTLNYLERAFDHAKYGELSQDPWLDVTLPSILDPGLAPAGAHVMSVYAHYAPFRLRGGNWADAKEPLLRNVLATLDHFAPGFRALVVAAEVIAPPDLESEYGFHGGHIFHGELALDQIASMRPLLGYARYAGPVERLYLCGAGTHPAGFMSGASGKFAARKVARAVR